MLYITAERLGLYRYRNGDNRTEKLAKGVLDRQSPEEKVHMVHGKIFTVFNLNSVQENVTLYHFSLCIITTHRFLIIFSNSLKHTPRNRTSNICNLYEQGG